jgi:septum formation protein
MILKRKLILASASPRRSHLLRQLKLEFETIHSGIDEELDASDDPDRHVRTLSFQKARAVAQNIPDGIIIGADTIVILDAHILGKPKTPDQAVVMLQHLSGKTHEVLTGFTLYDRPSDRSLTEVERTKVKFRTLTLPEIHDYVATGSPMDKAGAYGIQDDYGAIFVESIQGCFYNVVGFPLTKFYLSLQQFLQNLDK